MAASLAFTAILFAVIGVSIFVVLKRKEAKNKRQIHRHTKRKQQQKIEYY